MRHLTLFAICTLAVPRLASSQPVAQPSSPPAIQVGSATGWKSGEKTIEWVKALATPIGTVATLWIAFFTLRAGNRNQFRLKALEVALNSSTGPQFREKVKLLPKLFPNELGEFGKKIDHSQVKLFSPYERMMELLKLLAERADAERRAFIIETYAHMFPSDLESPTCWLQALASKYGAKLPIVVEAGMAFGRHPESTVLVTLGYSRPFSDVAGRHAIRISNSVADRQALVARLKINRLCGCDRYAN